MPRMRTMLPTRVTTINGFCSRDGLISSYNHGGEGDEMPCHGPGDA